LNHAGGEESRRRSELTCAVLWCNSDATWVGVEGKGLGVLLCVEAELMRGLAGVEL
jgi:hypothetical protein